MAASAAAPLMASMIQVWQHLLKAQSSNKRPRSTVDGAAVDGEEEREKGRGCTTFEKEDSDSVEPEMMFDCDQEEDISVGLLLLPMDDDNDNNYNSETNMSGAAPPPRYAKLRQPLLPPSCSTQALATTGTHVAEPPHVDDYDCGIVRFPEQEYTRFSDTHCCERGTLADLRNKHERRWMHMGAPSVADGPDAMEVDLSSSPSVNHTRGSCTAHLHWSRQQLKRELRVKIQEWSVKISTAPQARQRRLFRVERTKLRRKRKVLKTKREWMVGDGGRGVQVDGVLMNGEEACMEEEEEDEEHLISVPMLTAVSEAQANR